MNDTRRAAFLNQAVERITSIPGVSAKPHDVCMMPIHDDGIIARRIVTVVIYSELGSGWTKKLKEGIEELEDNLGRNITMAERADLDWYVSIPKTCFKTNPLRSVGSISYRYSDYGSGRIYTDFNL